MARQNFDSGIVKIDKNGNRVVSDYLDDGEELADNKRVKNPVIGQGNDSQRLIDESGDAPVSAAGPGRDNMAPVNIDGSDKSVAGEPNSRQAGGPEAPETQETDEQKTAREAAAAGSENEQVQETEEQKTAREAAENAPQETDEEKASREAAEAAAIPKETDNKDTWFAYAKTKGFEGAKDDLTKAQYVEQYGAK